MVCFLQLTHGYTLKAAGTSKVENDVTTQHRLRQISTGVLIFTQVGSLSLL